MYCSPHLLSEQTNIPPALRNWIGRRLGGPARAANRQRRRACLFALGRVGDFVLTLSALRLLVRAFRPDGCVLVIPAPLAALAGLEFPGVRCVTLPTEAASLLRQILPIWRQERPKLASFHFDQLICLSHQRSLYYEIALSWIAADRDHQLVPGTYPTGPADGLGTELLGHWRLVETVLGHAVARADILPRFTSLEATEDGRLLVYPLSRDATRNLPPGELTAILQLWRRRSPAPIVLSGGPEDAARLQIFRASLQAAGLENVSVEIPANLPDLLSQIARASAVFAGDSAPAHIATALDKACVVMTNRDYYGYCQPWARSERQRTFIHGTEAAQVAAALPLL